MISVKIMGTEPTLQMFGALQTKAKIGRAHV